MEDVILVDIPFGKNVDISPLDSIVVVTPRKIGEDHPTGIREAPPS